VRGFFFAYPLRYACHSEPSSFGNPAFFSAAWSQTENTSVRTGTPASDSLGNTSEPNALPGTMRGRSPTAVRTDYPFLYPFLPAKSGMDAVEIRHRRPISLCNPTICRSWLVSPPALGAGDRWFKSSRPDCVQPPPLTISVAGVFCFHREGAKVSVQVCPEIQPFCALSVTFRGSLITRSSVVSSGC